MIHGHTLGRDDTTQEHGGLQWWNVDAFFQLTEQLVGKQPLENVGYVLKGCKNI